MTEETTFVGVEAVWNRPAPSHRPYSVTGLLIDGDDAALTASERLVKGAARVAEHLEHIADWSTPGWKVGDHNTYGVVVRITESFNLCLTFTSEPLDDVRWVVFAASGPIRSTYHSHLRRLGFRPTLENGHWQRDLRISSPRDAQIAAGEILTLLTEAFGYTGETSLGFTLVQSQRADPGLLYRTLSPEDLRKLLQDWGYRADLSVTAGGNPVIRTGAAGFKFHIRFTWPGPVERQFGCLNFITIFLARQALTLAIINEISQSSRFSRLYMDEEGDLILERDVSLAGGVSTDYVHECLLDWAGQMESVSRKMTKAITPPQVVH